jgi:dephospho-CoA kinase
MPRIAITGGIAEGKSTVAGYLRELGYVVDSSDRVAREVYERPDVQIEIAELLGLSAPVPRETVRAAISDDRIRRALNRITHPRILAAHRESSAAVIEVPLLIEACLQSLFDRVWVVTCGEQEQLRRLTARLGSEEEAAGMIRTQLTSRAKIPFGDRIVRTNRPESTVKRFVTEAAAADLR